MVGHVECFICFIGIMMFDFDDVHEFGSFLF